MKNIPMGNSIDLIAEKRGASQAHEKSAPQSIASGSTPKKGAPEFPKPLILVAVPTQPTMGLCGVRADVEAQEHKGKIAF
jgi:hypothetical protein